MTNDHDQPLTVSMFTTAFSTGPALGTMTNTTWLAFARMFTDRREGTKDGANFILARFKPELDGRVRRLIANVVARTGVALDIESSKITGEVPPPFGETLAGIAALGWRAAGYTSHSHRPDAPRYRIVLPLSEEIAPALPAVDVIADMLGLAGVLDTSKIGPASLFYFPSAAPGHLAGHQAVLLTGAALDAAWMRREAGAILAAREAAHERQRAAAMQAAEQRREERIAAGHDPAASIIEAVRCRLDLAGELTRHGYAEACTGRFLFPGSQTGVAGVYVLTGRDGVERAYSHHSGDPLAPGNLPDWCSTKAVDAVDVVAILDHGGDLTKALATLAKRFGIETKRRINTPDPRRRATARAACRMIRAGMASADILARLYQLNAAQPDPLPADTIRQTAIWAARAAGGSHAAR